MFYSWSSSMIFISLIVPVLSFLLQVWPRLINRYFGIDTWRHLMFADYVRKHKKLPESITDRYIVSGPFDYPPGIILFLSLFPKSFADKYQFIFSPSFDFLNNLFIFFAAYFLSHYLVTALFAQIVAALTPLIVVEASNLSTRVPSYLIFSISFFSLLVFSANHQIYWLLIAYFTLFMLFLTHKFAIQAYFFNALGFSLIESNPFYILFFISVFLSVFIFAGKLYIPVLKGHKEILSFWTKNIKLRFAHQFRGLPKENDSVDFVQKLYLLSVKNPLMAVFGSNPWLLIFVILAILGIFKLSSSTLPLEAPIINKLVIWILLSVMSAILVLSDLELRFLGEGQRYIEYAVLPLSILLGGYFSFLFINYKLYFSFLFILLSICLLIEIIYLQYKTILKDRARTISLELWKIINYLNKKDGAKVRLAIFPINLGDAMMYFLKGRVLTSDSIVGLLKMGDIYPMVKGPMTKIIKKYSLNYVVIDQKYVFLKELKLNKYKIIFDENDYMLIKV